MHSRMDQQLACFWPFSLCLISPTREAHPLPCSNAHTYCYYLLAIYYQRNTIGSMGNVTCIRCSGTSNIRLIATFAGVCVRIPCPVEVWGRHNANRCRKSLLRMVRRKGNATGQSRRRDSAPVFADGSQREISRCHVDNRTTHAVLLLRSGC